ncbi:hypothetical protein AOLI_G00056880 [Acnodon oligacanthus]
MAARPLLPCSLTPPPPLPPLFFPSSSSSSSSYDIESLLCSVSLLPRLSVAFQRHSRARRPRGSKVSALSTSPASPRPTEEPSLRHRRPARTAGAASVWCSPGKRSFFRGGGVERRNIAEGGKEESEAQKR